MVSELIDRARDLIAMGWSLLLFTAVGEVESAGTFTNRAFYGCILSGITFSGACLVIVVVVIVIIVISQ